MFPQVSTRVAFGYPQELSRWWYRPDVANEKHLYMVVRGTWSEAGLAAEAWQFGLRMAGVFGSVSDIGTLPNNWTASATQAERSAPLGIVSTNYIIDGPVASGFSPDDWLQDTAGPALYAFWKNTSSFRLAKTRITDVRLYVVGQDGKVFQTAAGPAVATYVMSPAITGTNSGQMLPPQSSIAVSTRTPRAGRRGRGRFYLPGVTTSILDPDGSLTSSSQNAIAGTAATFLEELGVSQPGQDMSVRPAVIGAPWSLYAVIKDCQVGDRVDTIRRRRRQLTETYSSAVVIP